MFVNAWKWEEAFLSPEDIQVIHKADPGAVLPEKIVKNLLYEVWIRRFNPPNFTPYIWLSIKRLDKDCIRDWRHLQRIKNELVGPENEGVELFPAESRLADSANQYHLIVLEDPTLRFPFGYSGRNVSGPDEASKIGARQRPFEEPTV